MPAPDSEAVAEVEGPASGGPEDDLLVNSPLTYALEYCRGSEYIYYKKISEAMCQWHVEKYRCDPLVVPLVLAEPESRAHWVAKRGWKPRSGEPVKIVDLFVGGLNDPPP